MLHSARKSQRGNSFSSCLLAFVVVFGGLGLYYFHYLQWGDLEEPLKNLSYVKTASGVQKNTFRKRVVARLCDSSFQELDRLKTVRSLTKKGMEEYPEFQQDCREIQNSLKNIMSDGRSQIIPKKFQSKYEAALLGVHFTYRSTVALQDCLEAETGSDRKRLYDESLEYSMKAKQNLQDSRDYFAGKDWAQ